MGTQSHPDSVLGEPLLSDDFLDLRPLSPPGDSSSGATLHTRKISQGHCEKEMSVCTQGESYPVTISTLPDNVLLEIFDMYRHDHDYTLSPVWKWHPLVHVCQNWRQIMFESPHRLNLQIHCTYGTPVKKSLGIWPAIPIAIDFRKNDGLPPNEEDNVIAALEHPGRVCYLGLRVTRLQWEKLATVIQEPFPVLAHLNISSKGRRAPVPPAEFLGGSVPCLQKFKLCGIPFPALPTLLMSASNLVLLVLQRIPPTGYISPEAMVACLSPMHRLRSFEISFKLATFHPDEIQSPPITRAVLPALTRFTFQGASEYLEDLVVQIDCPQLNRISLDYSSQHFDFRVTQLSEFIDRSVGPELSPLGRARLDFFDGQVDLTLSATHSFPDRRRAWILVSFNARYWNFLRITQMISDLSATLSNVVHLELSYRYDENDVDTDPVEWLHLFHQFPTAKTLRVCQDLAEHVAFALEDITKEMDDDVLPSLDLIFLEAQPASSIERFLAARQLSGRPVTAVAYSIANPTILIISLSQLGDNRPWHKNIILLWTTLVTTRTSMRTEQWTCHDQFWTSPVSRQQQRALQ